MTTRDLLRANLRRLVAAAHPTKRAAAQAIWPGSTVRRAEDRLDRMMREGTIANSDVIDEVCAGLDCEPADLYAQPKDKKS